MAFIRTLKRIASSRVSVTRKTMTRSRVSEKIFAGRIRATLHEGLNEDTLEANDTLLSIPSGGELRYKKIYSRTTGIANNEKRFRMIAKDDI